MDNDDFTDKYLNLYRLFSLAGKEFSKREVILKQCTEITPGTYKITLGLAEPIHFIAGQYIWLILEHLNHPDVRDRRAMSILSSPSQNTELSLAFRTSDSGYKKTLLELPLGSKLYINGPRGSFTLPEDEKPIVLIAGGIAITPFISMLGYLTEIKSSRKVYLVSINSEKNRRIFTTELQHLADTNTAISVEEFIDARFDSSSATRIKQAMPGAYWFVAGPQDMVTGVTDLLIKSGVEKKQIKYDEFHKRSEEDEAFSKRLSIGHNSVFKLAVDSSINHVIISDIEGRILYANHAAERMTGYSFAEMNGDTPRLWGGLMSSEDYKRLWTAIRTDKKPYTGDFINVRKNGTIYIAHAQIAPIFNEKDELAGFIGMEEDITPTVTLESELKSKITEYKQLNDLTIERELKMIALKRELAEAMSKLENNPMKTGGE